MFKKRLESRVSFLKNPLWIFKKAFFKNGSKSNRFFRNRQIFYWEVKSADKNWAQKMHSLQATHPKARRTIWRVWPPKRSLNTAIVLCSIPSPESLRGCCVQTRALSRLLLLCCFPPGQGLANFKQYDYKLTRKVFLMFWGLGTEAVLLIHT